MYFTKNEQGELILVRDPKEGEKYLDKDGKEVEFKKPAEPKAPAIQTQDPIGELTGLFREMAQQYQQVIGDTRKKEEELVEKIKAADEAARRGFPMPKPIDRDAKREEVDNFWAPYDLAVQGKQLQDRFLHPTYQIAEEKRVEMAKWYILFLKATLGQDPQARYELQHNPKYNPPSVYKADLTSSTFPVPDIVDAEIFGFAREKSIFLQDARVWPMVSEKMSFPAESTNPTVAWGSTTGESTPTVSEVELTALELSAYSSIRNPLLQDSRSDIVSWLTELMAEAQGMEIDNCGFNGDGAASSASCSGILSAKAGYSVVFASGSTNFSEVQASHLSEMIAKLDGLKKVGARFYMNGAVFHYLRNERDTTNRPIFIETTGAPMSGTLFGYPYREAVKCPGTSAADTGFIGFGNLKYFAIGRRLDTASLEANPWANTPWTGNKTWFKLYQRWALTVALANAFVRCVTAAS